jgi:glycosyltransferase involved in cell wall biosynthesis
MPLMRVAVVTSARAAQMMGLEVSELRLLAALRGRRNNGVELDVRVVGRRGAREYARRLGARWYPSVRGTSSPRAFRGANLVHLAGLTLPPPRRVPFVATFYDLSPFRYDDEGLFPPWGRDVAKRAELLVCPSHFTASELQEQLSVPAGRIRVVPCGPGADVSTETQPLSDNELHRLGLTRPFALRLGGWTKRKNVPFLLDAWRRVEKRSPLTLALAGPPQQARDAQLAEQPLRSVSVLDYLPAELVPRLLRTATALVTTSTYEGFGLPVLEALRAGIPVVALRAPFVEEICADAALLAEDVDGFAEAVLRVAEDEDLRKRLVTRGLERAALFTWERAAEGLVAVYREADHRARSIRA